MILEAVPEPSDSDSLKSFFTEYMDETGSYIYKEQIEELITQGKNLAFSLPILSVTPIIAKLHNAFN